jgi:hypothetical protein
MSPVFYRSLALAALLYVGLPGRSGWLVPARGQPAGAAADKVYTYVEQMPQLPGGGSVPALTAAIQQRLVLPPGTITGDNKRVFVGLTVGKQGQIEEAHLVVQTPCPDLNAAVLAAVRQLPTLVPARQAGQPVRVAFTVPLVLVSAPAAAATAAGSAEHRESQTRRRAVALRQPGEADTTFLRRVLPVSYPQSDDLLAATWRPSQFGKQLFFSVRGQAPEKQEPEDYDTNLFMLDPYQAGQYAVQVFTVQNQGDLTSLRAFFFADVNHDGQQELLTISECSLREEVEIARGERMTAHVTHYQTLVFQYTGLNGTGRPQYRSYAGNTDYLNELATAAQVRQALARHRSHPAPVHPVPGKK